MGAHVAAGGAHVAAGGTHVAASCSSELYKQCSKEIRIAGSSPVVYNGEQGSI